MVRDAALKVARAHEEILNSPDSEIRVLTSDEWEADRRDLEDAKREATWRIVRDEVGAEGYDVDDEAIRSQMQEAIEPLEIIVAKAIHAEGERIAREATRRERDRLRKAGALDPAMAYFLRDPVGRDPWRDATSTTPGRRCTARSALLAFPTALAIGAARSPPDTSSRLVSPYVVRRRSPRRL